jgi:endonuclease/exonuclease/phosphatase family metal-dependent hydrolase
MTKISNKNNYKKNITFKNKNKKTQKTLEGGGEGEGEEETIIVLSWNILWMAMKGFHRDELTKEEMANGQSLPGRLDEREFGRSCGKPNEDGLNICATNVKNTIDELAEEYDFVALQEASKWDKIREKSSKLKVMGYLNYQINNTNLVTFYNKNKYKLIAFKTDFISIIIDKDREIYNSRPYHILYLQHKVSKEFYIFINLHLFQGSELNKERLEIELSKNMNAFFEIDGNKEHITELFNIEVTKETINNAQAHFQEKRTKDKKTKPFSIAWTEEKYNIIVAGDFNDANRKKFWNGFKPFKMTSIESLKDLEVKLKEKPPPTCCALNFKKPSTNNYELIGDYILVNSTLNVKKIYAPTLTIPTSDHLPVIIHLSPTYSKEDDANKLDTAIIPAAEAAIIPAAIPEVAPPEAAPPKAASPNVNPEISLVLANALIHEEKKPEECVPKIIHVLKIPGDGNCLFSSLFTGLIRLNADVPVFSEIPINQAHEGDVQAFVAKQIHAFRKIIVDSLETFLNATIDELEDGDLSELGRFIYKDGAEIDVTNKSVKQAIVTSYITNMRQASIWGDQIIIVHFIRLTNINVVIFNYHGLGEELDSNSKITISGNFCYNGIWLHYNGINHYNIIFPTNITNSKYRNIPELNMLQHPVARKYIKELMYDDYEDIIAITTIEEVAEAQAKPAEAQAKPAEAQAKPAEAQAKPAEAQAKPAEAQAKPAEAQANPANVKPEQNVALRIAGALTQALTQAPIQALTQTPTQALTQALTQAPIQALTQTPRQAQTKVEGQIQALTQAPTQALTKVEGQIQAPTQAQTKVKEQSEEQIQSPTQAPTKVERQSEEQIETPIRGQGEEENQIFRPDESNSGNMFVIPLMGVVLALAITFLVKK